MENSSTQGGGLGTASLAAATKASQLNRVGFTVSLGSTPRASITGDVKVLDEFNMAMGSVVRYDCFSATGAPPTKGDSGREGDGGLWQSEAVV